VVPHASGREPISSSLLQLYLLKFDCVTARSFGVSDLFNMANIRALMKRAHANLAGALVFWLSHPFLFSAKLDAMDPTIIVLPDQQTIAEYLAEIFISTASADIAQNGFFSVVLSGGGTPQPLYELLATLDYANRVDWAQVHLFWGDDRLVPPTEDGSNFKQVKEALIEHVPIPEENVWRIKTEHAMQAAVDDYVVQLKAFATRYQNGRDWPSFDFVLLGMGSDGHTASLFPGSEMDVAEAGVWGVSADYEDRPAQRITLTETILNQAQRIFVLVTGEKKAAMIANVINGEQDLTTYPIERIQPDSGHLTFVLDTTAARLL
jgi:6-phosphogluconolactonase